MNRATVDHVFVALEYSSPMGLRRALRRLRRRPQEKPDDVQSLNTKALAFELARQRAAALRQRACEGPLQIGLGSKPTTQADIESPWFAYWSRQLKIPEGYHRKFWEYAFVLQALHEGGKLVPGVRGLGFACGTEPLPSYLASRGIDVVATDLAADSAGASAWIETGQHAGSLESLFEPLLVDRPTFAQRVRFEPADMTAIPPQYQGRFDFCWSICAMEHLGSIEQGLLFVERAMDVLRPGGLAIHTMEFNFGSEHTTVEQGNSVLFLKRHVLELQDRLARAGHTMNPPEFDVGSGVFDRYVDLEPFDVPVARWGPRHDWAHLKLLLGGYPCTCFGIIVRKPG